MLYSGIQNHTHTYTHPYVLARILTYIHTYIHTHGYVYVHSDIHTQDARTYHNVQRYPHSCMWSHLHTFT